MTTRPSEIESARSVDPPLSWKALGSLMLVGMIGIYFLASFTDRSFLFNDMSHTISAAKNLLAGEGVATDIAYYDLQHRLNSLPVPLTDWPPGYPILVAPLVGLMASKTALLCVSYTSLLISAFVLLDILRLYQVPAATRWTMAILILLYVPQWFFARRGGSEAAMLLFTLLACAGFQRKDRHRAWLLFGGTCAGIAFSMRYAGLFFIAAAGLFFLLPCCLKRDGRSIKHLLLSCIPAGVVTGLILGRNLLEVGSLFGRPGAATTAELSVVSQVTWTISFLTGLTVSGLKSLDPSEIVAAVCLVTIGGWYSATLLKRLFARDRVAGLELIYVLFGMASLMACTILFQFEYVQPRYWIAFIPFIGITIATTVTGNKKSGILFPLLLIGASAAHVKALSLPDNAVDFNAQLRQQLQQDFLESSLLEFLKANASTNAPLLCNFPQELALATEKPVVGIPTTAFTRRILDEATAQEIADSFQVRYIVCLHFPDVPNDVLHDNQPFFKSLQDGKTPNWLRVIHSGPHVSIFERSR